MIDLDDLEQRLWHYLPTEEEKLFLKMRKELEALREVVEASNRLLEFLPEGDTVGAATRSAHNNANSGF